ncbi:MAG: CoA-binding protein [Cellulomonadaceae bacterium]|nr:CoA-binding protein [Cellulomonadaceae bacterium]
MKTREAAEQFLARRRIAVTGVSRNAEGHGANIVYQRLRSTGYEVFAVNPHAEQVEGDACYPDLTAIPGGVEAVVIGTRPDHAEATMREAVGLGITRVWMHGSIGGTSVSQTATAYGRQNGVTVIDGACPLMYGPTADGGHKVMCAVLSMTGKVPRRV